MRIQIWQNMEKVDMEKCIRDVNSNYFNPEEQQPCLSSDKLSSQKNEKQSDEITPENTRVSPQILCCCIIGIAATLKKILPCIDGTQLQLSTRLTLLLALTSLICLTLVCIVAIRHPEAFSQLRHEPKTPSLLKQFHPRNYEKEDLDILHNEMTQDHNPKEKTRKEIQTWDSLFQLAKTSAVKLHLQVESKKNYIVAEENDSDGTFKIVGRPNFCSSAAATTNHEAKYKNLTFSKTTHLILSHMADCEYYRNLALNNWYYPRLERIKLEGLDIEEDDFQSLIRFIDRHNETLLTVEIDDCYLCPGWACDAGMISYPDNDDFEFKISRRRGVGR